MWKVLAVGVREIFKWIDRILLEQANAPHNWKVFRNHHENLTIVLCDSRHFPDKIFRIEQMLKDIFIDNQIKEVVF